MSSVHDGGSAGNGEADESSEDSSPQSIAHSLAESAATYASRALEAHVTEDWRDFALFAGVAIEHAAKVRLAQENPAFLGPDRNFGSSVALNRASADVRLLPAGTQTVGAAAALHRCSQLDPGTKGVLDAARSLIAMRNGEAHMGQAGVEQATLEFVRFVRAMEALLPGRSAQLWSPHEDVVSAAVSERAKETDREVAAKLAAARIRFERFADGMESSLLTAMLTPLGARRDTRVDNEETLAVECPACGQGAVVLGYTEETGMEVDYDRDGNPENAWPVLTFFAGGLECEVCGLELDGEEELQAAQLELSWQNEEVDLNEWMRANYLDDDHY